MEKGFFLLQKKDDGDWWLYYGHDGQNIAPVGFWPKSLFNRLADHANMIHWGGYTGSFQGDLSPMGGGQEQILRHFKMYSISMMMAMAMFPLLRLILM